MVVLSDSVGLFGHPRPRARAARARESSCGLQGRAGALSERSRAMPRRGACVSAGLRAAVRFAGLGSAVASLLHAKSRAEPRTWGVVFVRIRGFTPISQRLVCIMYHCLHHAPYLYLFISSSFRLLICSVSCIRSRGREELSYDASGPSVAAPLPAISSAPSGSPSDCERREPERRCLARSRPCTNFSCRVCLHRQWGAESVHWSSAEEHLRRRTGIPWTSTAASSAGWSTRSSSR